jgi:hypothetical protein
MKTRLSERARSVSPSTYGRRARRTLALSIALAVGACGGGAGGGGGGEQVHVFHVMTLVPPDGGVSVSLETHVMAIFNDVVAPETVNMDSITVGIQGSGRIAGDVIFVGPTAIEFVPREELLPSTTYAVQVSPLLRSITGQAIGGTMAFLFRTTTAAGGDVPLPSTSQLKATVGKMNVGRRSHTAVELVDGRVLVAGGYSAGYAVTQTAELFNPSTEVFTMTGAMARPRAGHVAARLHDGRVLVAGGWYQVGAETLNADVSAEVFDPATQAFTPVGDMETARGDAAALVLPDGRVLVTGGSRLVGGFLEDHFSAEVFDPVTSLWTTLPTEMHFPHAVHSMVDLSDGRFLVAGGSFDLGFEIYNTVTGVFSALAAPVGEVVRFGGTAASFADGDVVVCGGDPGGTVSYFERESTTVISTGSGLGAARSYATAVPIAGDQIIVAGGIDIPHGQTILTSCDLIVQGGIAGSRTYGTSLRLPRGLANHTATRLQNGKILFAGGLAQVFGQTELSEAWVFTPVP